MYRWYWFRRLQLGESEGDGTEPRGTETSSSETAQDRPAGRRVREDDAGIGQAA